MSTLNNGINGTLGNGLIGHWSFDNGSLLDESGNGRNLTMIGTVTSVPDKDGNINNAFSFAGTNNSLEVAYTETPVNPYISVWVKMVSPNNTREFLVAINALGGIYSGFCLGAYAGKIGLSTYIGQTIDSASGQIGTYDINDGNWHHVLVMYDRNNRKLKIYVDKVLRVLKLTLNADITYSGSNKIQIGLATTFPNETNDILDEPRIGNRVLTGQVENIGETATGEIAELFDMGVNYGTKCETPIATPSGGSYTEAQTVILTCATPNSTIYYTLNGTNPTIFDDFYTEPISIIESTTIKAKAFANGIDASEIMTESYIINYPLETITMEGFYQTKLRNEITGEYVYILGKTNVTSTTFAHVKKYNIYGQLKQSQVAINNKTTLDIGYILEEDKDKIEKWWESKSTIWIEQENKIPILCTFVDTDFALKEEYDSESDNIYYTGTLNFE